MSKSLEKTTPSCQNPVGRITGLSKDDDGDDPDLHTIIWSRDLEQHPYGEFSFAEIQANLVKRDYSQIEIARDAIFVGVYDGHGDSDVASHFVAENLCKHFTGLVLEAGFISEDSLKNAVVAMEKGYLASVEQKFDGDKSSAEAGSSCLAGVIWRGSLYVANVGNSRAVMGYLDESKKMVAEQFTRHHNVNVDEIREEVKSSHQDDDPYIVVENHGEWRIKGILQISRAIGSAYMKKEEYYEHPYFYTRYNLPKPFRQPLLKADPESRGKVLKPCDKFLIFASDGLWENLTIEQAVDIVNNNQRAGIARRLIIRALEEVAKKRNMKFDELKRIQKGTRRSFHDDITVVVVFIDHWSLDKEVPLWESSICRFRDVVEPTSFSIHKEIDASASPRTGDHPLSIQDNGSASITSPPSKAILSTSKDGDDDNVASTSPRTGGHPLSIQDEGSVSITSPPSKAMPNTRKDDDIASTNPRTGDHPLFIQDEGSVSITSPLPKAILSTSKDDDDYASICPRTGDHPLSIQDEEESVSITSPPCKAILSSSKGDDDDDDDDDNLDDLSVPSTLFWSQDPDNNIHMYGHFSFAVMQANEDLEDNSLVDVGFMGTFVGVYDGHGGPDTSLYITENLVGNLTRLALERGTISEDILKNAVIETENGFLDLVRQNYPTNPEIAAVGSCCLVGVIWEKTLYVANVGDSQAVIGFLDGTGKMVAQQLTPDHSVGFQESSEVHSSHLDGVEVSRAIGHANMKAPEPPIPGLSPRPLLIAEPSMLTRRLQPSDRFVIFASDGLWEFLTKEQAVHIVSKNPHKEIAKRLIKIALIKAAKRRHKSFDYLMSVPKGRERRSFHGDITVVVIFIEPRLLKLKRHVSLAQLSICAFSKGTGPSKFNGELAAKIGIGPRTSEPLEGTSSASGAKEMSLSQLFEVEDTVSRELSFRDWHKSSD